MISTDIYCIYIWYSSLLGKISHKFLLNGNLILEEWEIWLKLSPLNWITLSPFPLTTTNTREIIKQVSCIFIAKVNDNILYKEQMTDISINYNIKLNETTWLNLICKWIIIGLSLQITFFLYGSARWLQPRTYMRLYVLATTQEK